MVTVIKEMTDLSIFLSDTFDESAFIKESKENG